jgi:hypothetical protein
VHPIAEGEVSQMPYRKELNDIIVHMDGFGNIARTLQAIDDAITLVGSIQHSAIKDDATAFSKALAVKRSEWQSKLNHFQKETDKLLKSVGCSIDQGGQGDECMVDGVRCHNYHLMNNSEEPCKTCFEGQFKTGKYKNWTRG